MTVCQIGHISFLTCCETTKHARVENAYWNVLFLLLQDISWTWHPIREKRLQGKVQKLHFMYISNYFVTYLQLTKVVDRFSDFAVQNAMRRSKRRRTRVKPNGLKPTARQRARNWLLTRRLSLRSVATHHWNTTESYGRRPLKRWRELRKSDRGDRTTTLCRDWGRAVRWSGRETSGKCKGIFHLSGN